MSSDPGAILPPMAFHTRRARLPVAADDRRRGSYGRRWRRRCRTSGGTCRACGPARSPWRGRCRLCMSRPPRRCRAARSGPGSRAPWRARGAATRRRSCGVNDSNEIFLEVTGWGALSRGRAMDALRGLIASGSVVATDGEAACFNVLAELGVAAHEAYDPKDRSGGTINRVNAAHSLLDSFIARFRGVSTKHLGLPRLAPLMPHLHGDRLPHGGVHGRPPARQRLLRDPHPRHVQRPAALYGLLGRARRIKAVEWSHRDTRGGVRPCRRTYRSRRSASTLRSRGRPPSSLTSWACPCRPPSTRSSALVREGGMPFEMRVGTPAPDGETAR